MERLDVFEEVLLRFVLCGVAPMIDPLALQRPEEAFDAGGVPTMTVTTHASRDAVGGEVRADNSSWHIDGRDPSGAATWLRT